LQLNLGAAQEGKPSAWGKELVFECARRNGRMVAGWQVYGFMVCTALSIFTRFLNIPLVH
jgi:hypothetical protein